MARDCQFGQHANTITPAASINTAGAIQLAKAADISNAHAVAVRRHMNGATASIAIIHGATSHASTPSYLRAGVAGASG